MPFIGLETSSPLKSLGFKDGDHITKINDVEIAYFHQIRRELDTIISQGSIKNISVEVKRYENFTQTEPKFETLTLKMTSEVASGNQLGLYIPETMVAEVKVDSPAAKSGMKKFDRLIAINAKPIQSFNDIVKHVSSFQNDQQPLQISVLRNGLPMDFEIVPNMTSLEGRLGVTENRFTIGIVPLKNSMPQIFTWKSNSFSEAFDHSVAETWKWTSMTCLSFVRMIQGRVPAKNIGGFISIGQAAQQSWAVGLSSFLKIMAIISINLFIINLFPVPILDGGQLVIFLLEAIKGSPLSLRKIEIAQQVGFIFILFLMAFALFNDFSRIFGS